MPPRTRSLTPDVSIQTGDNLMRIRGERELSREELSKILEGMGTPIAPGVIRVMEVGWSTGNARWITVDEADALARALGITIGELTGEQADPGGGAGDAGEHAGGGGAGG